MELHTTLLAIKAALTGQPMTPLPAAVVAVIDPTFANGMGSLQEDPARGLRCPFQGCGRWFHHLGQHAQRAHPNLGGAAGLRAALSIPSTAPLVSSQTRARMRAGHRSSVGGRRSPPPAAMAKRAGLTRRETLHTMGARNLQARCDAQLRERLITLERELGHTPAYAEAQRAWGTGLPSYCIRVYGTWNDFKRRCGVTTLPRGGQVRINLDMVVETLGAYAAVHGDLPTSDEAARADRSPPIPHPSTILRVMCTTSWDWAMRRTAAILGLKGGRYGVQLQVMNLLRRCEGCTQLTRQDPCDHCGAPFAGVRTAVA